MSDGYSLEDELAGPPTAAPVLGPSEGDLAVREAIKALDKAMDSRSMAVAMQKAVALKVLELLEAGKIGSGDLVRLMGMVNDRADGKVTDVVEVSGTIGLTAILADLSGRSAGLPDLSEVPASILAASGVLTPRRAEDEDDERAGSDDDPLDFIDAEVVELAPDT